MAEIDQKIDEILTKGVEQVLPSKKELKKLMRKRKIQLYLGIDPTSPDLHLGHAVPLRKLKQFQELGHEVILLFGTFTAQIGDPSGRDEKRKPLTPEQIKKNMTTYRKQASKILDFSKVEIKRNADWLAKLTFKDLAKLASYFTVSRLLERDMFRRRFKKGEEVWANEFLYPLMQGYDSVAMNVDLEIGATDQLFNMLVGRKLQRIYNRKEKFVLTTPMLEGLDGRNMSKTYGNTVNIMDSSKEMFGELMSLKDNLIIQYFRLCTELSKKEVQKMEKDLKMKRINPRDAKARLAREIVTLYYSSSKAKMAESEFNRVFRDKKTPKIIPEVKVKRKITSLIGLLMETRLVKSKSEAKRLVLQKGVRIDGVLQEDWQGKIKIKKGMVIQVGRRKFIKIA